VLSVRLVAAALVFTAPFTSPAAERPNLILVMSDDQGWGDVAYNGNQIVKTPQLDTMAREGVRLDRFYAAAPVCSPTRASCLTGRHPYRVNIPWAGDGELPFAEITTAEVLRKYAYTSGHFGKWHLGQLSRTLQQSEFPTPVSPQHYSPPWNHGFDACFSSESMMPTYNPYHHDCAAFGEEGYRYIMDRPVKHGDTSGVRWRGSYWEGPGRIVDENLAGDSSAIIVERALRFINEAAARKQPFYACIWFQTPHTPIVAGDDTRALYPDESIERQHWFGCLTAMDTAVGKLRSTLREWNIADNTLVWFCSDNGPSYIHDHNSAGPFSGKKATLLEGGIRVPGIVEWPDKLKGARTINTPLSTSDFHPTLLAAAGIPLPENQPVLDGENVLPILLGEQPNRSGPIFFQAPVMNTRNVYAKEGSLQAAVQDGKWKLATYDGGTTWRLHDLSTDPAEKTDLSTDHPTQVATLKAAFKKWQDSCQRSANGADYSAP